MPVENVVTVSPKFQVVIPRAIREALGIRPGQKVQALLYRDRVELVPFRPVKSMRGFLRDNVGSGMGAEARRPGRS